MNSISPNTVILQDQTSGKGEWLLFQNPVSIVEAHDVSEVMDCLQAVERHTQQGMHAAGFISYEAASAMDPAIKTHALPSFPLVWFGIYAKPEKIDLPDVTGKNFQLGKWEPSISWDEYHDAITRIREHILAGDTYQVNFTMRLRTAFSGNPWSLFLTLYEAQRSGYSAFVNLGRYNICSVSPELFFSIQDGKILCKPMKGTIKRGMTNIEDMQRQQWLHSSEKNRAENLMIVDMIRNDIGMLADIGTVRVEKLFSIEKYPTVHQMTSTVVADVTASMPEILCKMFPCASITGAPKIKTMEIITHLEKDPRGIYTGSIGYISPGAKAQFNVAIRTVVVDLERNSAEYGVGGGIVWDSESSDEYEECKAKAAVLTYPNPEFNLLESILWDGGHGYHLLEEHIDRLADSAEYFQYPFSIAGLREKLDEFSRRGLKDRFKVRIELPAAGEIVLDAQPLAPLGGYKVGLANEPVHGNSRFLFHKTTHREIYEDALRNSGGCRDVILWNDAGHITESCIANIVITDNGEFVTPPVNDGLLAGVFRRTLLEARVIRERVISKDELRSAARVFLINSVRGWIELEKTPEQDTWLLKTGSSFDTPAC